MNDTLSLIYEQTQKFYFNLTLLLISYLVSLAFAIDLSCVFSTICHRPHGLHLAKDYEICTFIVSYVT